MAVFVKAFGRLISWAARSHHSDFQATVKLVRHSVRRGPLPRSGEVVSRNAVFSGRSIPPPLCLRTTLGSWKSTWAGVMRRFLCYTRPWITGYHLLATWTWIQILTSNRCMETLSPLPWWSTRKSTPQQRKNQTSVMKYAMKSTWPYPQSKVMFQKLALLDRMPGDPGSFSCGSFPRSVAVFCMSRCDALFRPKVCYHDRLMRLPCHSL